MTGAQTYDVEVQKEVEYAKHDGVALSGDIYLPKGSGPFPALVAVHGGGWRYGSRQELQYWGPLLARNGYGLYTVSYRLAAPDKKMFPEAVHDIRAAVQFTRGNATRLRLDPERLGLIGISAGAQLASLVALAGDSSSFVDAHADGAWAQEKTNVKVVVGIYGVYDLVEQYLHDLVARPRDQIVPIFLGKKPADDRQLYFNASPLNYATIENNQTAFLLGYGTDDDIVNRGGQSEAFLLALKQAGFFVRTVVVQSAGHFWAGDPIDEPSSFTGFLAPRLQRFLAEKL